MDKNSTPRELGATISQNYFRGHGPNKYRHVVIELPDKTEFELNFAPEDTEDKMLDTPIRDWRII